MNSTKCFHFENYIKKRENEIPSRESLQLKLCNYSDNLFIDSFIAIRASVKPFQNSHHCSDSLPNPNRQLCSV